MEVSESWERCSQQVEEVLQGSGESNPFVCLPWLETWWRYWGAGKRLQVYLFRRNGAYVGFAPLWYHEVLGGREYFFVGHRKSNYLGIVSNPGEEDNIWRALFRVLQESGKAALLHLVDLNSKSPAFTALAVLKDSGVSKVIFYPLYPCPHAILPGDWEEFFSGVMRRKRRTQMRAADRRLASLGEVRFRLVTDAGEISSLFPKLQALHKARFEQNYNPSLDGRHAAFMQEVVPLIAGDKLVLAVLELDGEPAAFLLGLRMGDTLIDYIPAFDPALERYSPGHVLILRLTQWLISQGYRVLDFSKGDEVYKRRWSNGESVNYVAFAVVNSNPMISARLAVRRLLLRVRLWLRARGYNRTIKRQMAALRRIGDWRRGVRGWRPRVRSVDTPSESEGSPVRYGKLRRMPLEVRTELANFCYAHHQGQPVIVRDGERAVTIRDGRSGQAIEVSW